MTKVLAILAASVALGFVAETATAQDYPSKPIELVVAYSPGGTTDTIGRLLAARMSEKLGQPVVVENRAGATGQIGSQYVASSAPDGYTLQIAVQTTHAVAPTFYGNIGYDPVADFTPTIRAVGAPLVLITHAELGVESVDELIEYVRARPGQVSYATGGTGDGSHMAALFFNSLTGLDSQHVPHQGEGPAVPQVMGGHLPYMFVLVPTGAPFVDEGQAVALAVTSETRSSRLPDVPTMQEAGLEGYAMETWWGIFGPAGMPEDVVNKLNAVINEVLEEPETRQRILDLGFEVRGGTAQEFSDFVVSENKRWAGIITEAGLAGAASQ